VKDTLLKYVIAFEISKMRRKLNELKMVVDRSSNGIKCKNTRGNTSDTGH